MQSENKDKNRIYNSIKADDELKNNILKASKNAIKGDLPPENDELSLRRNEKMKKNEYGDMLKKVAVASFSLIATGGIIVGVISYNSGNKQSAKIAANNKTTELSTGEIKEETSEKVTEETTEEMIDEFDEDEDNVDVFDPNSEEIKFYDAWTTIKIDNNRTLEVEEDGDVWKTGKFKIFVSEGGNKKEVDKVCCSKFYYCGYGVTFRSYGKNLYYFDDNGLKKLDTESLKAEYVFKDNDYKKIKGKSGETLFYLDDKKIFFSISGIKQLPGSNDSEEWESVDYYMYEYDIQNAKLELVRNREFSDFIDDEYILTKELAGYKYDLGHPYETRVYVEKIENGKLKEVCCLGDRVITAFHYMEENLAFSAENKNMFYYENHEKELKSGKTDFSETTIMSYDIKTKKTKKIATISAKKLGLDKAKRIFITELRDGYCKFVDGYVDEDSTYKYEYKTGKLEKIDSTDEY